MPLQFDVHSNYKAIYNKIDHGVVLSDQEIEWINYSYKQITNSSKELTLKYEEIIRDGAENVNFLYFKFCGLFACILHERYEFVFLIDQVSLIFAIHAFIHQETVNSDDEEGQFLSGEDTTEEDVLGHFE